MLCVDCDEMFIIGMRRREVIEESDNLTSNRGERSNSNSYSEEMGDSLILFKAVW
jgi:hypothetical protein